MNEQAMPSTNGEKVWHALSTSEVFRALKTSPSAGISVEDAEARLQECGPNELKETARTTRLQMLISQFKDTIVLILIAAALISALIGDYLEAGAILAIVVLNAILGVIQEGRAEEALAALRKLAAPEANIIRGGRHMSVPARELVAGDLVLLETGNYVPADLRLIETVNLRIEEAALTGESVPVEKDARAVLTQEVALGDRRNTAFSGTLVSYGRGRGIVVSTGMYTQIGMIAAMLQSVHEEPTPLQIRLDQLGRLLGFASLAVCAVVFGVGWLEGTPALEMFIVAVSLAVAAVPEGLAAVVTITLALGMQEMIKRHALIRRLASVETLGSTTVICSDKTGTLTQNQMTITRIWVDGVDLQVTGNGYDPFGDFLLGGEKVDLSAYPATTTALFVGALANDAQFETLNSEDGEMERRVVGDPTEAAFLVAASKAGAEREDLEQAYPRIDEIPFDSVRKRMTTVHKIQDPNALDASPFNDESKLNWEFAAIKGAPDIVLELCTHYQKIDDSSAPLTDAIRDQILAANEGMAQNALRVLGVAYRVEEDVPDDATPEKVEHDLTFIGLMGMIDPPREAAGPAIEKARNAGIRSVMITGDYPDTARAIAEKIGLLRPGHKVMTGAELAEIDDETLQREVVTTDVFARVSPEHKVRIVDALKQNGEIVAMTGDGVNDAPALKRADIGVAMGITGTDVAKETADMVLTDDNFASIVSAVEQGRVIYSNIRKFVFYLLSCNMAEILSILIAILMGLPSPLNAIQLLWLNLVTDGAPALALGMEKGDPDTMERPPRPPTEPIINRSMQWQIVAQTIAITAVTLAAFFYGWHGGETPEMAGTMAFVTLSFSELLRAFTARSEHYPLLKIGLFSNPTMFIAVLSSLVLLLAVVYVPFLQPIFSTVPLTFVQWEVLIPLLLVPSIVAEISKWLAGKKLKVVKI
ncbi:MAG: cation-translocating P-type ATPase [Anaerolineales bacterium]|nr:cation-translocating P-type ATPase [Anaerolineales bacterium]